MKKNKRAFTLIELLVVVLILGILAAVALPQYQKAVEKSRVSEALTTLSALEKALDNYVLENGFQEQYFLVDESDTELVIDVGSQLDCSPGYWCKGKNFGFQVECYSSFCAAQATRMPANVSNWDFVDNDTYSIATRKYSNSNQWVHSCQPYNQIGQYICTSLASQGWSN